MKQRTICKTLAVAVILLFISVGVQPAIAQPDLIDIKPNNMDKNELISKINEIIVSKQMNTPSGQVFIFRIYLILITIMNVVGFIITFPFALLYWLVYKIFDISWP